LHRVNAEAVIIRDGLTGVSIIMGMRTCQ
jgi:hypothetical protein